MDETVRPVQPGKTAAQALQFFAPHRFNVYRFDKSGTPGSVQGRRSGKKSPSSFRRFRTRGVWKAIFGGRRRRHECGAPPGFVLLLALAPCRPSRKRSGNWQEARERFRRQLSRPLRATRSAPRHHPRGFGSLSTSLPDTFRQAVLATEEPPFPFRAFPASISSALTRRHDRKRSMANSVVQGGSTITTAIGQETSSLTNEADDRAQGQGSLPWPSDSSQSEQERKSSGSISTAPIMGGGYLWRGGGGAILIRQGRHRGLDRRKQRCRGPVQGALCALCAAHTNLPAARAPAAKRGAVQPLCKGT